ncbi:MAG TPA: chemotaxis protein CheX [Bacillus sp. (in: firmicutes)]|uniref:chemotaxis protein CheX n=1 Tax=Bacillus litorisediminis TaxID=2922713 RepID=UPI001FAC9503|nr:chemotaxis protein CheX [Bacillus litorisediminis]HWO76343.1 chemotaxis protein CheX [Bacillus sp. (in: firmicutes)]
MQKLNQWDTILDSTIRSVHQVLPVELEIDQPEVLNEPFLQEEIGVFIGISGDFPTRLILEGKESTYSQLGEKMFGMPLMGEMVESFSGELGNMIGGHLSTLLSEKGIQVDITPPQTIVGQPTQYNCKEAYKLAASFGGSDKMNIWLIVEE